MSLISTTEELAAVCSRLGSHPFVSIDTEFLRETTFWPKVCLIQMASPVEAVAVDTLAEGLDLTPLFDLMADRRLVKVFHAARQDLEIFWNLAKLIPEPLFDTQVAAMVCGYGDQVAYSELAQSICKVTLDKSSRFTDWSRRPLAGSPNRLCLGRCHLSARHIPGAPCQTRDIRALRLACRGDADTHLPGDL